MKVGLSLVLDKTQSMQLPSHVFLTSYLIENYDSSRAWDVTNGRKNASDAAKDFAAQWESQNVSYNDFVNYYTDVSALVVEDAHFEGLVRGAWHL